MRQSFAHRFAVLALLVFALACPATMYVHLVNLSAGQITVRVGGNSMSVAPGESAELLVWPGAGPTTWEVVVAGVTFRYDRAFEPPAQFVRVGAFSTSIRAAVDERGLIWLLPPESESDATPVTPQPEGFPLKPSTQEPVQVRPAAFYGADPVKPSDSSQ